MKKLIFSGLLTLTLGMVSAKDIQQVSEINPVTAVKTEAIVSSDIQETITSTQATNSGCGIFGKVVAIVAMILGADDAEADKAEGKAKRLCDSIF